MTTTPDLVRRYPNLPGSPISVTQIIDLAFPRPELRKWQVRQAARLAREHPETPIDHLFTSRPTEAMNRGTAVHKAIEVFLASGTNGDDVQLLADEQTTLMYMQWLNWWGTTVLTPVAAEVQMLGLGYAGTCDLLAIDGGEAEPLVICDWKTTGTLPSEPWFDHAVQLAAYADCQILDAEGNWVFGPPVQYGKVVYLSPDGYAAYDIAGDQWLRACRAWNACIALAEECWPELF